MIILSMILKKYRSWSSSVSRVTALRAGRGSEGIFLLTKESRPTLGLSQPYMQWIPEALSQGKSGEGAKLGTYLHLVPKLRMRGAVNSLTRMWDLVKHRDNFTFTLGKHSLEWIHGA
jgi:hypothetical protein